MAFKFVLLLLVALLACIPRARAAESYDNCTGFITAVPAVIASQGTWCLKQDLSTAISSGNAITISTNNVTLDCNYFKLGGLPAGIGTQAVGVYALNRLNVVIRHCNIRGFYGGVGIYGGGGHAVVDSVFDGNTRLGIEVQADGSVIQRNRVSDTGGSTAGDGSALAIVSTQAVDTLDNQVFGATARTGSNGNAYGIYTYLNLSGVIAGNRVSGLIKAGTGQTVGIYADSSTYVTLRDNEVVGPGASGTGLRCTNPQVTAMGNVTSAFATGIDTCSNGGGNFNNP